MRSKFPAPSREVNPNGRAWTIPRFAWSLRITPDTEHVINLMTLHFGISKNAVCVHAVHKLWDEVSPSIDSETLASYERKVAAARMYRLAKLEAEAKKTRNVTQEELKEMARRRR